MFVPGVVLCAASPALAQTYNDDIRPIIEDKCVVCHSAAGLAFSMEDPEEAYERRRGISRMVTGRRMPPWLAEAGHQEYQGDVSLTDEEVDVVDRWSEAGFPLGAPSEAPARPAGPRGFASDIELEILPGVSYQPNQSRDDDYRCFVVDWSGEEP